VEPPEQEVRRPADEPRARAGGTVIERGQDVSLSSDCKPKDYRDGGGWCKKRESPGWPIARGAVVFSRSPVPRGEGRGEGLFANPRGNCEGVKTDGREMRGRHFFAASFAPSRLHGSDALYAMPLTPTLSVRVRGRGGKGGRRKKLLGRQPPSTGRGGEGPHIRMTVRLGRPSGIRPV